MAHQEEEVKQQPADVEEPSTSSSDDDHNNSTIVSGEGRTTASASHQGLVSKGQFRAVLRSKILVLIVIATTAVAFGAAVYVYMRRQQRNEFETQFHDLALEVVDLSRQELQSALDMTAHLATTITLHTMDTGSVWPEFVLPHFQVHGESLSKLSRIEQLTIVPLVPRENVQEWQTFSKEHQDEIMQPSDTSTSSFSDFVFRLDADGTSPIPQTGPGLNGKYAPVWQQYPAPFTDDASSTIIVNFDLFSSPLFEQSFTNLVSITNNSTLSILVSDIADLDFLFPKGSLDNKQRSFILHPVHAGLSTNETLESGGSEDLVVGFIVGVIAWDDILTHMAHSSDEANMVLQNTCGSVLSYKRTGSETVFVGSGDAHDSDFDYLTVSAALSDVGNEKKQQDAHVCVYKLDVYPTRHFQDRYLSSAPLLYSGTAVILFFFTVVVFVFYDFRVQRVQRHVIAKAERTNRLISDLFPGNVRERLLREEGYTNAGSALLNDVCSNKDDEYDDDLNTIHKLSSHSRKNGSVKSKHVNQLSPYETKPIADLFPNATVMFADIVGFTAWSSVREPKQVFTLLETLYYSFDTIAKRRRVFKVETVGDCYVAVCGLPDPNANHASVMARFARDCMKRMEALTSQLETTLGPDTGDLSLRIGLHSGPVTAGVLRGDKSRFQLFGDTVNTAARIETTGQRSRIHMSMDTAEQLRGAGKGHWVKERNEVVSAKGKGEMQTCWLDMDDHDDPHKEAKDEAASSEDDFSLGDAQEDEFEKFEMKDIGLDSDDFDVRTQRLVSWNAELLLKLLKQIVARRTAVRARSKEIGTIVDDNDPALWPKTGTNPIEEVKEIIHLPEFDVFIAKHEPDPVSIDIDEEVVTQLTDFVRIIASMYRSNPFHNFEHASHVAMSVSKLLSRIVAPSALGLDSQSIHSTENKTLRGNIASTLHDHTYGITSDPLTQFSCVLAALIHDVDHTGVPNTQLVKEKVYIARTYNNQSVAEQNSVDAAWDLLMDVNFRKLRKTICVSLAEQQRFRQLVVNSVMATDICDKDLKALRNARWERAFSEKPNGESKRDSVNRKATIVIEHLIQASDVAHTMQHWHIYRKWNERLFQELLLAYRAGRSETDPAENWYQGELGFFDFYIIPLAKKLKDCGVFGVSCDEVLNYAQKNRKQWEHKGKEIVANMVEQYQGKYGRRMVQLDGIQDADGSALRSSLFSNETDHMSRRTHDSLDFDNMSADTSPSFALSGTKSFHGTRSLDGSTDTIFEDLAEDMDIDDEDEYKEERKDQCGTTIDTSPTRSNQDFKHSTKFCAINGDAAPIQSNKTKRSDATCSTTQANTEWGHDSVDSFYHEDSGDAINGRDTMENVDLYCLQNRINKRLVGSITNTRAYDTKSSITEMSFM